MFNGPRLSCIKSAIECLVHREFHGHKRLGHGVSHNLRVVAESGLEGTKRTSTGNTGVGLERVRRNNDWRENVQGEREREGEGGDESKEKGNKLMVSENAGMETRGRWRNLLENDQKIYLVSVDFILVVDRSFVNYYSLFAVILLVE